MQSTAMESNVHFPIRFCRQVILSVVRKAPQSSLKLSFLWFLSKAVCMFFGESLCFLVFHLIYRFTKRRENATVVVAGQFNANALVGGNQKFNPLVFLPPALCDMIGTSLSYIGLNLTYASSFQMLRGRASTTHGIGIFSISPFPRICHDLHGFIECCIFGKTVAAV